MLADLHFVSVCVCMCPHEYMHICTLAQRQEEDAVCAPPSFSDCSFEAEPLPEPGAPIFTTCLEVNKSQ